LPMSTDTVSPLRQRMIEDMNARKLCAGTQRGHRGHVDFRWGTNGNTLTMSWTERDGPLVSPPERRGFGSTVIASMAKATIGGEVQLDYAPSRLVWRLTCPAANGAGDWGT
jgi:two-component sensor histidine kinase